MENKQRHLLAAPLEYARRSNEIIAHPYRTEFMRDRDRVMYCSAFRRLSGKTQIYLSGKNDHQRNRLTHTLEVSQIARTISSALGLDCDLTEAIALGHDLGHTPFGHAGEQILHEIMVPGSEIHIDKSPMKSEKLSSSKEIKKPLYGFKHNAQSVRIAASLETNYGDSGLNLTNYTLWGILHHSSLRYKRDRVDTDYLDPDYIKQYDKDLLIPNSETQQAWSFEAFVVAEADEIAQWHHDMEDAMQGKAMSCKDVCTAIENYLQDIMNNNDRLVLRNLSKKSIVTKKDVTNLSRIVVDSLVTRFVESSRNNLEELIKRYDITEENRLDFFLNHNWNESDVEKSMSFSKLDDKSDHFLISQKNYANTISEKIHHSRDVERMNAKGQYIIKKLFQAYFSHPQQLPDGIIVQYMIDIGQYQSIENALKSGIGMVRQKFENLISSPSKYTLDAQIKLMRKICDHIAGMTDHYAIEEYENLYG